MINWQGSIDKIEAFVADDAALKETCVLKIIRLHSILFKTKKEISFCPQEDAVNARDRVRQALLCRIPDQIPKALGFFSQTLSAIPRDDPDEYAITASDKAFKSAILAHSPKTKKPLVSQAN